MKKDPPKHIPQRSPDQTILGISMPKELKNRIKEAAQKDRRPMAQWCVIQLEEILKDLESDTAQNEKDQFPAPLKSVADAPGHQVIPSKGPTKYPPKNRRGKGA